MKWLVGIALVVWAAWSRAFPTYTVRWKLTVEVNTPQGVRSASTVLESSFFPTFGAVGGASSELKGEAVFVDLGEGKNVLALLAHGRNAENIDIIAALPVTALTGAAWGWSAFNEIERRRGAITGKGELKGPHIPTLITFSDLKDPNTARVIHPSASAFEEAIGPGYSFARATMEIIPAAWWPLNLTGLFGGQPITTGLTAVLPWWGNGRPTPIAPKYAYVRE